MFGSNKEKHENCDCDVIVIGMKTKDNTDLRLSLLVVPLICEPFSHQPVAYAKEEFDHLQELDLAKSFCGTGCLGLDLLFGSGYYWRLLTEAVKRGSAGPIAMETRVGWVLSGPMEDPSLFVNFMSLESNHTLYLDNNDNSLIELRFNNFWNLESLGITSEESSVHQNFCDTITFKDGRYQVKLPWKE